MGLGGHADEELGGEVGELDNRLLRQRIALRECGEDGVVRHAYAAEIVAGELGAEADEAEVDLAAVERPELLGAGHVEKVERDTW
jgi:hypothetical protein